MHSWRRCSETEKGWEGKTLDRSGRTYGLARRERLATSRAYSSLTGNAQCRPDRHSTAAELPIGGDAVDGIPRALKVGDCRVTMV
jgi:hypothetical protein